MAILSDALHDLGDSFSLGLSWYLDRYSKGKRPEVLLRLPAIFAAGGPAEHIILLAGGLFVLSRPYQG
jgi:cobalt-zinc-cadmium efflux system protein